MDVDSTPDGDNANDDPTDPTTDEDDIDNEMIAVGQVIDVAIDKAVNTEATPGPYTAGNDVTFTLTVTNEGEVDVYNV